MKTYSQILIDVDTATRALTKHNQKDAQAKENAAHGVTETTEAYTLRKSKQSQAFKRFKRALDNIPEWLR